MRKGLRGFVDDALSRTGPLAVEKSGDFPTARPFAHKLHRALFVSYNILEGQNQPHHRSVDRNWQGSTYQRTFSVQTNGATSPLIYAISNYSGALDRSDKLDRGHARAMNFSFSVDVQVCKRTDVDRAMKSFFRRSEQG